MESYYMYLDEHSVQMSFKMVTDFTTELRMDIESLAGYIETYAIKYLSNQLILKYLKYALLRYKSVCYVTSFYTIRKRK